MAGNRQIVEPPTFTPTPFGLLTVVQTPTPDGPHWQNGITYIPVTGDPASTYDECIAVTGAGGAPSPPAFANNTFIQPRGATPFTVYVEFDCAPVGNEQAADIARTALTGVETWQVERSFWTGLSGSQQVVFPHLAANAVVMDAPVLNGTTTVLLQTAAVTVTGVGDTATGVAERLGLLEGALADCYNGVGVIHIPQIMTPTLSALGLIKPQGSVMKTANGNLVAIGAGYPGTSPAGAARTADQTWMYATGAVFMYRSDIKIRPSNTAQAMDKAKNTIKMIAERTYVLGWDACHFAIQATLGTPRGT